MDSGPDILRQAWLLTLILLHRLWVFKIVSKARKAARSTEIQLEESVHRPYIAFQVAIDDGNRRTSVI